MTPSLVRATALAADAARAALATVWPRSAARQEVARLREEGHPTDLPCELAFSVCVAEPADVAPAMAAIRAAGWAVEATRPERGFLTARAAVRLRAAELAWSVARLERVVAPFAGFVEVIGPDQPTGASEPTPRKRDFSGEQRLPAWA